MLRRLSRLTYLNPVTVRSVLLLPLAHRFTQANADMSAPVATTITRSSNPLSTVALGKSAVMGDSSPRAAGHLAITSGMPVAPLLPAEGWKAGWLSSSYWFGGAVAHRGQCAGDIVIGEVGRVRRGFDVLLVNFHRAGGVDRVERYACRLYA